MISETATNSMADATYFGSGADGNFLEFAALQHGRCAISCIHPNAPRHGPPTSSPVQVNLGDSTAGLFTVESPANRVRGATAAGYVQRMIASSRTRRQSSLFTLSSSVLPSKRPQPAVSSRLSAHPSAKVQSPESKV